jgi:cysteinyl-tRNA synthetase
MLDRGPTGASTHELPGMSFSNFCRAFASRTGKLAAALIVAGAVLIAGLPSEAAAQSSRDSRSTPQASAKRLSAEAARHSSARRARIAAVKSWGFWLRFIDIPTVAASPHDLLVLDFGISANRRFLRARTPEEIAAMKVRTAPDAPATPRILLAYLSFAEAERYRPYWRQDWYEEATRPVWLGLPNPRWAGNWAVRYWHPDWQRHIYGTPESYLELVMAQGFDGVYLDRADAYHDWQSEHPRAKADMIAFLTALAAHARTRDPNFLVVMQNAEELAAEPRVLTAIDGIGKEDLYFGIDHTETANSADDVAWSLKHLKLAQRAGRKILAIEYLTDPAKIETAVRDHAGHGFVPYIGPRGLQCLAPPPALPPLVATAGTGALPACY